MNIQELEREIVLVRERINKTKSWKMRNDLVKYLKRLTRERNDYYRFRKENAK